MLTFNSDDRKRITATITTNDIDLDDATLVLEVDDARYPCEWTGAATNTGGTSTRTGRTVAWFAGPSVPTDDIDSATLLSYGPHAVKLIVTDGTAIVTHRIAAFTISR